MKDATEARRGVIGVLLGVAFGALIGILARPDRDAVPHEDASWAEGSRS